MQQNILWQVTNKKVSQHLKELGVKQESTWYWKYSGHKHKGYGLTSKIVKNWEQCSFSAYTVAELGKLLPIGCYSSVGKDFCICNYYGDSMEEAETIADTEADARGKLLIYLLENKLTEVN